MSSSRYLAFYVDLNGESKRRFGEQTRMFEELTRVGNQHGFEVLILTPGFAQSHTGWKYNVKKQCWAFTTVTIPDIVIRRSGTFSARTRSKVQADLSYFTSHHLLHTLPFACSNKWNLYSDLVSDPQIKPYLPFTQLASNSETIYKLARLRKDVYVKPVAGSQGISIFRLRARQEHGVRASWEYRSIARGDNHLPKASDKMTQVREQIFFGPESFNHFWAKTKLRSCVVQDTVRLKCDAKGSPFDFRWLIQSSDIPQIIARVVRVGRKNAVTTNIHSGASAMPAEQLLAKSFPEDRINLLRKMDEISLSVVSRLAKRYGQFAEIGIDLAVDKNERIFLFEANPTPGRRMLRALPSNVREMSLQALVEYATRVTGI